MRDTEILGRWRSGRRFFGKGSGICYSSHRPSATLHPLPAANDVKDSPMRARREVTFSIGGLTVQARRLAAVIAGLALCLIALGGYVRGTDAGLSCPDWPLCYGRAVPDTAVPGVFQEVGHRYLASLVSFGVLLFSALAFRRRRELPRVWSACRIAVLVLLIQICLGGLTVLLKLNPFIVTAHLAMGTVMFQLFARLAVERAPRARGEEGLEQVFRPTESSRPLLKRYRALRLGLKLLVTAVSLQILLGGFLGSSGAALSCPELPLCFDRIFPTDMGPQPAIHMLHRLVAVAVLLIAVAVALTARTARPSSASVTPRRARARCASRRTRTSPFFTICVSSA